MFIWLLSGVCLVTGLTSGNGLMEGTLADVDDVVDVAVAVAVVVLIGRYFSLIS